MRIPKIKHGAKIKPTNGKCDCYYTEKCSGPYRNKLRQELYGPDRCPLLPRRRAELLEFDKRNMEKYIEFNDYDKELNRKFRYYKSFSYIENNQRVQVGVIVDTDIDASVFPFSFATALKNKIRHWGFREVELAENYYF